MEHCSVGCGRPVEYKKWHLCGICYRRKHKKGELAVAQRPDPVDRFWSYVDRSGACWLWIGCLHRTGYGRVWFNGCQRQAHRVAYELEKGPIPDSLQIDHVCRNRACVRPAHMEPVTIGENLRRGVGASAMNSRKTHCPQGHPYTPENTYVGSGNRKCRICNHERSAARAAASKIERQSVGRHAECSMCSQVFEFVGHTRSLCSDACRHRAAIQAKVTYRRRLVERT